MSNLKNLGLASLAKQPHGLLGKKQTPVCFSTEGSKYFPTALVLVGEQQEKKNVEYWKNLMESNLSGDNSWTVNKMVDLIKYPVITEKTYRALFQNRQFTFDVDLRLSKPQLKKLFEGLFNVNIISINTHIPPRKKLRVGTAQGYKPRYKRAILTLKEGQSLNYNLIKK